LCLRPGERGRGIWERSEKGHPMRQNGTVKFFNASKGYGFITPDDGGKDVFVHVTAVERSGLGTLADGQRVSFETEPDKRGKGPKAVELQPAS
jgi:CspA family cold shock protein